MTTNLASYRQRPSERERVGSLLAMISGKGRSLLDIGARDGHLSCLLKPSFGQIVALDLKRPDIPDGEIVAVSGDVTQLEFPDNSFDAVLCAEVLEHIPANRLQQACDEISRVARRHVLIGVPYRQDTRVGRSVCTTCGNRNPPWGHVNVFDEYRLRGLFPDLRLCETALIGCNRNTTNFLAAFLMDLSGNPYGTYDQDEGCTFCGAKLIRPGRQSGAQRMLTKAANGISRIQSAFVAPHANWIHVLFDKKPTDAAAT